MLITSRIYIDTQRITLLYNPLFFEYSWNLSCSKLIEQAGQSRQGGRYSLWEERSLLFYGFWGEELAYRKREDRRELQGLHCVILNVTSSLAHLKGPRDNICLPLKHQRYFILTKRAPGDPSLRNLINHCHFFPQYKGPKAIAHCLFPVGSLPITSSLQIILGVSPVAGEEMEAVPGMTGLGAGPVNRWTMGSQTPYAVFLVKSLSCGQSSGRGWWLVAIGNAHFVGPVSVSMWLYYKYYYS